MTMTYDHIADIQVPCAANPKLFDLDHGGDPAAAAIQCASCPFPKAECARLALAGNPDGRVWAGVPVAGRLTTGVPRAAAFRRLRAIAGLPDPGQGEVGPLGRCGGCARPLRRRNETVAERPGTVMVRIADLCHSCARLRGLV